MAAVPQSTTKTLSSNQLKNAWPDAEKKALEVAAIREDRARNWAHVRGSCVKPEYEKIVTPESRINLAALMRRSVKLMQKYLDSHPVAASGYMQVHSYQSHARFLDEPILHIPSAAALQLVAWSKGMLIYTEVSKKAGQFCFVVAAAPQGGGGTFKTSDEKGKPLESPCWGQEEQAIKQMPSLMMAVHGGFTTRDNQIEHGSHMEIHPVMVTNVVPLAKLGRGAVTTKPPRKPKDRNLNDSDFSTNVFHANEAQFKPDKALLDVEAGNPVNALFFSFADMRPRKRLGQKDGQALHYTEDDLRDMVTSAGTAIRLWVNNSDPKEVLHYVGVGTGIYEHSVCVSLAVTNFALAEAGREGVYYGSEGAFNAAQAMLLDVCQALRNKNAPLIKDDFVKALWNAIEALDENQKPHWRIGGAPKDFSVPT